jgi:hypothetical protein
LVQKSRIRRPEKDIPRNLEAGLAGLEILRMICDLRNLRRILWVRRNLLLSPLAAARGGTCENRLLEARGRN